jgi:hypothetical protein
MRFWSACIALMSVVSAMLRTASTRETMASRMRDAASLLTCPPTPASVMLLLDLLQAVDAGGDDGHQADQRSTPTASPIERRSTSPA